MQNKFDKYKKLLNEFVSFRSISTDPKYLDEIGNCVKWLKNLLKSGGFETEIWNSKNSNPVVFADYFQNKKLETLLIYGHYDVQPAEKTDGWKSEPFTLTEGKTKLFGRGVVDNKGQILAHITSSLELIKTKKLNYNLKFLIEGNEETSNPDLAGLMKKNKNKLECDILMVSDGELTNNKPTIEVSLRGGFNATLTFRTGKNNLHSGIYGGAVPNASLELSRFLSKLINPDNSIAYKEFYRGVDKISRAELANNKRLTREARDLAGLAGVKSLLGEKGVDFYTQTGLKPTIQITGIKTGYIEQGYSNIVPGEAEARLNFRLAASQNAKTVAVSFEKFVKANTPKYVDYKFISGGLHNPIKVNMQNPYLEAAVKLLESVYKTKVNKKNVGGAIPFVGDVKDILGVDTLLIPMVNEDCNMHGANENFDISLAKKALEFSLRFLSK